MSGQNHKISKAPSVSASEHVHGKRRPYKAYRKGIELTALEIKVSKGRLGSVAPAMRDYQI